MTQEQVPEPRKVVCPARQFLRLVARLAFAAMVGVASLVGAVGVIELWRGGTDWIQRHQFGAVVAGYLLLCGGLGLVLIWRWRRTKPPPSPWSRVPGRFLVGLALAWLVALVAWPERQRSLGLFWSDDAVEGLIWGGDERNATWAYGVGELGQLTELLRLIHNTPGARLLRTPATRLDGTRCDRIRLRDASLGVLLDALTE